MGINFTKLSFEGNHQPLKKTDGKLSVENNSLPEQIQSGNVPLNVSNALKAYVLSAPLNAMSFKGAGETAEIKYIPDGMTDINKIEEIMSKIKVNGKKRFDKDNLSYISDALKQKPEGVKHLEPLLKARDGKLSGDVIGLILSGLNKDNEKHLEPLLKDRDGELSGEEIRRILPFLNRDNEKHLEPLLKARDGKLSGNDIGSILRSLNKDNEKHLEPLLKARDGKLSGEGIGSILSSLNKDNEKHLEPLLKARDGKICAYGIGRILPFLNKDNEKHLDYLLKARDGKLSEYGIGNILSSLNKDNEKHLDALLKARDGKLSEYEISCILSSLNKDNEKHFDTLLKARDGKLSGEDIGKILPFLNKDNEKYLETILKQKNSKNEPLALNEIKFCLSLGEAYKVLQSKNNIKQLSLKEKRTLLKVLVKSNSDSFDCDLGKAMPILPKNKDQYCSLMKKLVENLGIDKKPLTDDAKKSCFSAMNRLEDILPKVNLENMQIMLKNPKDGLIKQAQSIISELPEAEKLKVMEYFGFEINDGKLSGYPANINNGKKLAEIDNPQTKTAIEKLRPHIKQFSEENKIILPPQNKELEDELNKITRAFPEFLTTIGKKQHETHHTLDIHILKALQEVMKDSRYKSLNESDKRVLQFSTLLHDITKREGVIDKTHAKDSAFDAYMIIEKLGLSNTEEKKLYSIIASHEWAADMANSKDKEKTAKDIAFELRKGNSFEMEKILTDADLKAVKRNNAFYDKHSVGVNESAPLVEKHIKEIQSTAIALPQTKIPKASQLKTGQGIKEVEVNGIKNKVIYMNQNPNLEAAGFEKGTKSDNFYNLVHAFDDEDLGVDGKIAQFVGLKSIETDSLLSTSFIKPDDYKVFRKQGFVLDVNNDDIGAAYFKDFGSGFQKDVETLKREYLFDNKRRKEKRNYISDKLKEALGHTDEQHIDLMKRIENCRSITDIEKVDKKVADAMQKVFKEMENGKRAHGRQYNEVLALHPRVQGVFAYDEDIAQIPKKLRKHAQENDLPIIIFGDPAIK